MQKADKLIGQTTPDNQWQKVFGHSQKSAYDWFFNVYFRFEQLPPTAPPLTMLLLGDNVYSIEVIVLLENIITAVINIVLGGKGGIKFK